VMQLFGLVNTLLAVEQETARSFLNIITYSVIPLSPTSGIISWVPNAPTFNTLINGYRKERNIKASVEKDLIAQYSPARPLESLPLIQRIDLFQRVLAETKGDALAQILWLNSLTAERWLERRTKYTRSLAVMSIVGYILGLGDRHLSNLMLDQISGEVLHIDFGDCFEVAIHRDKFPETVPFRLTRMLVKAMGVSGVEGNFRASCEATMDVLHTHKDSVMAMLEAFLHDPLVNWRLMGTEDDDAPVATAVTAAAGLEADQPVRVDRNVGSVIAERRPAISAIAETSVKDQRVLNAQARKVIRRVQSKLLGTDFPTERPPMTFPVADGKGGVVAIEEESSVGAAASLSLEPLDIATQVDRLIKEAQSHANLVQLYSGWNPYW